MSSETERSARRLSTTRSVLRTEVEFPGNEVGHSAEAEWYSCGSSLVATVIEASNHSLSDNTSKFLGERLLRHARLAGLAEESRSGGEKFVCAMDVVHAWAISSPAFAIRHATTTGLEWSRCLSRRR